MRWPESSTKHSFYKTFLKNFVKFTEKEQCQSLFLKHSATLKEDSGTSAFLWILKSFKNIFFFFFAKCLQVTASAPWKTPQSIQNLPQECWYNNLETCAEKFVLVKFQSCIGNWLLQVVLLKSFFHSIFRTPFHRCLIIYTNSVIFISHLL